MEEEVCRTDPEDGSSSICDWASELVLEPVVTGTGAIAVKIFHNGALSSGKEEKCLSSAFRSLHFLFQREDPILNLK